MNDNKSMNKLSIKFKCQRLALEANCQHYSLTQCKTML